MLKHTHIYIYIQIELQVERVHTDQIALYILRHYTHTSVLCTCSYTNTRPIHIVHFIDTYIHAQVSKEI